MPEFSVVLFALSLPFNTLIYRHSYW